MDTQNNWKNRKRRKAQALKYRKVNRGQKTHHSTGAISKEEDSTTGTGDIILRVILNKAGIK